MFQTHFIRVVMFATLLCSGLALAGSYFSKSESALQRAKMSNDYDTIMLKDRLPQNLQAPVDYYMLALSWSPSFCHKQKQKYQGELPTHLQYQCGGKNRFGWVIHGLWAQNAKAQMISDHPRYCQGDLPMLPEPLLEKYLPESPGMALLQGEWEKHGACAFSQAEDYFAQQKALYQQLTLPTSPLSKQKLFEWLRAKNPQLRGVYIGSSENELYFCYNKQWQLMDCPRQAN